MRGLGRVLAGTLVGAAAAAVLPAQQPAPADSVGKSWTYAADDGVRFRVEVVATGVAVPWGIAFLPDGRALVTDRPTGRLSLLDLATGALTTVEGVPPVYREHDGGMLDVALHPDFRRNGWVYLSYSVESDSGSATAVDRARIRDARLVDRERLFTARPAIPNNGDHFGGRLVLDRGYLYISVGDRDTRELAQQLSNHYGKVVRLHDDGRVPRDNPFVGRPGALPEIWSYGHRNPQGLARHPETGELWEHEHGPRGGDEVNVVRPGRNYGWPAITYGQEYRGGPVGEGITAKDGMEQPLHYYVPSIAPSGMDFYTGRALPRWRGSLFIGGMAIRHLNRLVVERGAVVREERLLADKGWRIRSVREGPDGFLYIGIDGGAILRLRPE
ncbi:MAG TPA: PQQ-dependent sugar dehydrogenase [Gemmatimonadaceae bacterium]|nr:PQQ-dependent sugar dehydrogenase [Gemmatimonadaceae bacterium]